MTEKKDLKIQVLTRPNINTALIIVEKNKFSTGFFELNFLTDAVKEGQWLKGRIFDKWSDLSEDGKHIIYNAIKYNKIKTDKYEYTVLSKFPYFKALDFYTKGYTYDSHGGGLFIEKNKYLLNEGEKVHNEIYKNSNYTVKRGILTNYKEGEYLALYYARLIRDGWKYIDGENRKRVFKKYFKHYEIEKKCRFIDENNFKINGKIIIENKNWMDFKNGKLYWTSNGKIFYAYLSEIANVKLVIDLNKYQYKSIIVNYP